MKRHLLQGVLFISIIILSSCSRRIIDFTIISSKNVPITNQGGNFQKATKRVKGVDSKWSVLFIPGIPDMKEAIDNAIEQYPGAIALTDGVIYNKSWSCYLFGQNKYIVEGTPLFINSECKHLENRHFLHNEMESTNIQQPETASEFAVNYQQERSIPQKQSSKKESTMRVEHKVEQGETMAKIAALYKTTILDILRWNKLSSIKVYEGMKLIIYI